MRIIPIPTSFRQAIRDSFARGAIWGTLGALIVLFGKALITNYLLDWADKEIIAHSGIAMIILAHLVKSIADASLVGAAIAIFVIVMLIVFVHAYWTEHRLVTNAGPISGQLESTNPLATPKIDILFEPRSPYETSEPAHGHVVSTVRIGIKNSGNAPISNCKVYIEKISPPISLSMPILLREGFILRHDDPELRIDIATHWDHINGKYRFSSPLLGGFADAASFIDDQPRRTIKVLIESTECQRSATFDIWTDKSRRLHLEFVSYVD